jgi:hypothetical protein
MTFTLVPKDPNNLTWAEAEEMFPGSSVQWDSQRHGVTYRVDAIVTIYLNGMDTISVAYIGSGGIPHGVPIAWWAPPSVHDGNPVAGRWVAAP